MKFFTPFELGQFFQRTIIQFTVLSLLFLSNQLEAQNASNGGSISANQTICPGETPESFVSNSPASGGGSNPIEYMWMTTTNVTHPISGWNMASGDNTLENYSPPALGSTTYFVRCARRQGFSNYAAESNIVVVNVANYPTAIINGYSEPVNSGEALSLTASYSTFATYFWDFDGDGITDCTGQNCSYIYTTSGAYDVALTVDNGSCSLTTYQTVFVLTSLPVEFISFDGQVVNEKEVQLNWKTGSEVNNNFFEIERSLDGTRFDFIGKMESQGNSNTIQSYSLLDKSTVEGKTYYRLKQVDFDGNYSFSNIISISIESEKPIATVIPNPIEENAIVRFSGELSSKAKLQILNTAGQVVGTYKISSKALEINTSGLEKGVYFLRIKNAAKIDKAYYKIVVL